MREKTEESESESEREECEEEKERKATSLRRLRDVGDWSSSGCVNLQRAAPTGHLQR